MTEMKIRRAEGSDLPAISRLREAMEVQAPALKEWPDGDMRGTLQWPKPSWESYHGHIQLVASEDGKVVGFIAASLVTHETWERLIHYQADTGDHPAAQATELLSDYDLALSAQRREVLFLWLSHVLWEPEQDFRQPRSMQRLADMLIRFFMGHNISGVGLYCAPEYSVLAEHFQIRPIRQHETFTVNTRVRRDLNPQLAIKTDSLDALLTPWPWIQKDASKFTQDQVNSRIEHKISLRETALWGGGEYIKRVGKALGTDAALAGFGYSSDHGRKLKRWGEYIHDLKTKAPGWVEATAYDGVVGKPTYDDLTDLDNPSYLVPGGEWLRARSMGWSGK